MKVYQTKRGIRRRKVQVTMASTEAPSGSESSVGLGSANNTPPPPSQSGSAGSTPAPHPIGEMPIFDGFEMVDLSVKKRWKVRTSATVKPCFDETPSPESILLYARVLGGSGRVSGYGAVYRSTSGGQVVLLRAADGMAVRYLPRTPSILHRMLLQDAFSPSSASCGALGGRILPNGVAA